MTKESKKMPSIFKMASNFAKDLSKYIKEGAPNVSHAQYTKRLEACAACPNLNQERMRCTLCGCLVEHKAKWKTTTCPDKPARWEHIYQPLGTPDNNERRAKNLNKNLNEAMKKGLWDPKDPKSAVKILERMAQGSKVKLVRGPGGKPDKQKGGDTK